MVEGSTFSELVKEAFIDPLRSVLIIDDQYPTWEEILSGKKSTSDKDWKTSPTEPLEVIKQFRNRNPGFIIDIHDATPFPVSETSQKLADHLHQSDLLVLDYNLEGESLGGTKARSILQSVLENKHFNLVVVHTSETDLDGVLYDCILSTIKPCAPEFEDKLVEQINQLDQKLTEYEDVGDFDRNKLPQYFDTNEYIFCRQPLTSKSVVIADYMQSTGKLASLSSWAQEIKLKGGELKTFLYWAVREFENSKEKMFTKTVHEGLRWNNDANCKWLRTVRGFVVFVGKGSQDLLTELRKALESWEPTPSRLLSAKYRHELNRIGVEAEDRTLLRSHVFAHFYKDICNSDGTLRAAKLKEHVARQSEAISFHIENDVANFGERIVESDSKRSFSSYYGIDLADSEEEKTAVAHYNSYISTLPLKQRDDQLDSGHIFKVDNEWWVCATPACDLQPTQNSIAFSGISNNLRPFTALRLYEVDHQELSAPQINSGEFCFIEQNSGKLVALGIRAVNQNSRDESKIANNDKVTWRLFLAENNGLINNHTLVLLKPKLADANLEVNSSDAIVISKLRYEYALNYIRKVGASVSRIGLGYASIREAEQQ